MKFLEMKRRLAEILEVPEDPVKWVTELLLVRNELLEQKSPKMLDTLLRALALECVWYEFQKYLRRKNKDPDADVTIREIEILTNLTGQVISKVELSSTGQTSSEDLHKIEERLLEAISVLKSSL